MIESTDQLGRWLRDHFADRHHARQRTRQRAIAALEGKAPCPIDLTSGPSAALSEAWTARPIPGKGSELPEEVPTESGARLVRHSQREMPGEEDDPGGGLFDAALASRPPRRAGAAATAAGLMGFAAGTFAAAFVALVALSSVGWI